jgi:hypothetical protein
MPEERAPLSSVDAVRAELRRLGYLDRGLDRFVLGDTGDPSTLHATLRAAGRVGLAGGVLFGIASTAAAVGLDPRLLAEPRDLAVLAAILMAATGIASALAAAVGGIAAAFLAGRTKKRPGPALARNIGLAVALLGVVYLALWWRSHLASASWPTQAAGLLLGLLLTLALGRFVSLAACTFACASASDMAGNRPRTSRRDFPPSMTHREKTLLSGPRRSHSPLQPPSATSTRFVGA